MAGRTVSIGAQGFAALRERNNFLVDKTAFVRDWWEADDQVTLVCRPRRFGKTLTLDMVRCFLSTEYAGRGEELFGGMDVWADPAMRALQGTVPVVAISFAACKGSDYALLRSLVADQLREACAAHSYLFESTAVDAVTRAFLARVSDDMDDVTAMTCLNKLCSALYAHHGTRPVVLLDEYDTPMQEAWLAGCWEEMSQLMRGLFNSTFKTNPSLGRALITGITRVASESIFSDMNNPRVVTTTSEAYATVFGFTEDEVHAALDEMGLADRRDEVRDWYDGFTFGCATGIYNPWSISNYLAERRIALYWVNSSSNRLAGQVVAAGDSQLQAEFSVLLEGGTLRKAVDETVDFRTLMANPDAAWALLLATGYLRADRVVYNEGGDGLPACDLSLTNREVRQCFERIVRGWFARGTAAYNGFTRALLAGDLEEAEAQLGNVLLSCASSFDGGTVASASGQPERFYHGLVLGMLVDLRGRYRVTSNGESGYGRYDVVLEPLSAKDPALVLEFKVLDPRREKDLDDTVERAKRQIRDKADATRLVQAGIEPSRIREVGLGFSGQEVRIG